MTAERCPDCGWPMSGRYCTQSFCGYVRERTEIPDWLENTFYVLLVVFIIYVFVTVLYWFIAQCESCDQPSLLEVVKSQWEWLKRVRIW